MLEKLTIGLFTRGLSYFMFFFRAYSRGRGARFSSCKAGFRIRTRIWIREILMIRIRTGSTTNPNHGKIILFFSQTYFISKYFIPIQTINKNMCIMRRILNLVGYWSTGRGGEHMSHTHSFSQSFNWILHGCITMKYLTVSYKV